MTESTIELKLPLHDLLDTFLAEVEHVPVVHIIEQFRNHRSMQPGMTVRIFPSTLEFTEATLRSYSHLLWVDLVQPLEDLHKQLHEAVGKATRYIVEAQHDSLKRAVADIPERVKTINECERLQYEAVPGEMAEFQLMPEISKETPTDSFEREGIVLTLTPHTAIDGRLILQVQCQAIFGHGPLMRRVRA